MSDICDSWLWLQIASNYIVGTQKIYILYIYKNLDSTKIPKNCKNNLIFFFEKYEKIRKSYNNYLKYNK